MSLGRVAIALVAFSLSISPASGLRAGELRQVGASLAVPEPAAPPYRLRWPGRAITGWDLALAASLGAAYLYVEFEMSSNQTARWVGGLWFDDAVQGASTASSSAGRDAAARISDGLSVVPIGMALFDSVIVPLVTDNGNASVAARATLLTLQAEAIAGLVSRLGHRQVSRERPDTQRCRDDPTYARGCFRGTLASFPSGHVAGAAAATGVLCAHHLAMPLYGGGLPDQVACASHVALTTAVGFLRLRADRHYLSDVIAGAAIGFGAGFALPWFAYYGAGGRDASGVGWTLAPIGVANRWGLGVTGIF